MTFWWGTLERERGLAERLSARAIRGEKSFEAVFLEVLRSETER